jgi:hypothetical protein
VQTDPAFEVEPDPSEEQPALRECDDGRMVLANQQSALDALAGCTSLYGLTVSGPLDLRPLAALRRVGLGGVNVGSAVTSLAGLEGLEVATRFSVYNAALLDLHALSSLRYVEALEVAHNDGPIVDLDGLENVTGIRILRIFGNQGLESLKGLTVTGALEYVVMENNPRLSDVAPLSGIERVARDFTFIANAAEALRLDALQTVLGRLIIRDNPALTQLFVGSAVALGRLELLGSQPIASGSFERLTELGGFVLEDNWLIRDVPAFPVLASTNEVRIAGNYELRTLTGFSALGYAGDISISNNENLVSVDLSALREAASLFVYANPALDGPSVVAALAGVASARQRVAPTQAGLPVEPCPWTEDDYCDANPTNSWGPEYQQQTLCRAESDPACAAE